MSRPTHSRLALVNGLVMREAGADPERLDIIIADDRIESLQPPHAPLPGETSVIDITNGLVIPGLVNAHCHSHDVLARGMFEDIPLEVWIALAILPPWRQPSPREVRLRTLLLAAENLRNGTTLVQDMLGCGPGSEEAVAAAVSAYNEIGIRCVLGLQVGNRPAIDCLPGIRESMPPDVQPLIAGAPVSVGEIMTFVTGSMMPALGPCLHWAVAPGSPQRCTLELLAELGALARRRKLPLVTHVNESKLQVFLAEELYADHGGSVLDFLAAADVLDERLCMAHGVWFSDAEIARIANAGAAVATCPLSNLKLKNGIAPHLALHASGVRLALGCDNVSAGDVQNMFEAMRLLAVLSAGKGDGQSSLRSRHALQIATQGGADVLGLGDRIGSLREGKLADLAVLDLREASYLPLNDATRQTVYAEGGRSVRHVVVNGRVVVRDGSVTSIDFRALAEEVADFAAEMQGAYREHFERLQPALPHITALVRRHSARPLPYARWPLAGDPFQGANSCP